jgi:hypothetical protein
MLNEFREHWPSVFAGTELDRMTGGALRWRTVQNQKSLGEIPKCCFVRHGKRKLLIRRDPFLDWWESQLEEDA